MMSLSIPPNSPASNHGGRVPVDMTPSALHLCTGPLKKSPLTVSQHCNCATVAVFCTLNHQAYVVAHNGHATTVSKQEYDELQLWDLDCLLTDCT